MFWLEQYLFLDRESVNLLCCWLQRSIKHCGPPFSRRERTGRCPSSFDWIPQWRQPKYAKPVQQCLNHRYRLASYVRLDAAVLSQLLFEQQIQFFYVSIWVLLWWDRYSRYRLIMFDWIHWNDSNYILVS